nr:ParB-like protein [Paraburkholderia sp. BL8N3]
MLPNFVIGEFIRGAVSNQEPLKITTWRDRCPRQPSWPIVRLSQKVEVDNLPGTVADMPDDPYQSLAAFLRIAGVFQNPGEFNAKFAWADYLFADGCHERPE